MDRQIFVYVDLDNSPHLVGRLWLRVRNRTESATFQYDSAWLQNPERFALEPPHDGPGATDSPRGGESRLALA